MNNRAVEETVETFMVVLHSSDPYVTLNPGASNATVSIIDSSSKSVLVCVHYQKTLKQIIYKVELCTELFYAIIPTLFPCFLLICYPYILLHF